ncbi:MAG: hypothetical protein U0793_12755 [Gemmataceae bacterium]
MLFLEGKEGDMSADPLHDHAMACATMIVDKLAFSGEESRKNCHKIAYQASYAALESLQAELLGRAWNARCPSRN